MGKYRCIVAICVALKFSRDATMAHMSERHQDLHIQFLKLES